MCEKSEKRQNVVVALLGDEEAARKAMAAVSASPAGEEYEVPEAVLVAKGDDGVTMLEGYEIDVLPNGGIEGGLLVSALAGILVGPLGFMLGGGIGAVIARRMMSGARVSIIGETAKKLYAGEYAIIALVSEVEPAFDAVLEGHDTTIIRYDADAIAAEVRLAREAQLDIDRENVRFMAARAHEDIEESLRTHFDALKDSMEEIVSEFLEGVAEVTEEAEGEAEADAGADEGEEPADEDAPAEEVDAE